MQYEVRQVEARSAEDALVALWRDNLTTRGDLRDKARWFYRDAPAGAGSVFLLESVGGASAVVVGCAGVGLRAMWVRGAPLRAALLADFAVERAHRTVMPALLVQRAVHAFVKRDLDLAYGYPNASAAGLFKRLDYVTLGHVDRWVRVLRVSPYLERRALGPLGALGGRVLDVALGAFDRARGALARRGATLEWPLDFDARFDALWGRAREAWGVVGERSGAALRWRFLREPGGHAELAALVDRGSGALVAYAVLEPDGDAARIRDLFAANEGDVERLLAALLPVLAARGFASASLMILAPARVRDRLEALAFRVRDAGRPVVLEVGERGGAVRATLLERDAWLLTEFDEDNG